MSRNKKIAYTRAQLEAELKKSKNEGFRTAEILFLTAVRDEFAFGEKRLLRIIARINRYDQYVEEGLIKIKETKKILEKSTGMKFL